MKKISRRASRDAYTWVACEQCTCVAHAELPETARISCSRSQRSLEMCKPRKRMKKIHGYSLRSKISIAGADRKYHTSILHSIARPSKSQRKLRSSSSKELHTRGVYAALATAGTGSSTASVSRRERRNLAQPFPPARTAPFARRGRCRQVIA